LAARRVDFGTGEHIIKGRPFGVRFECVAQTSPERSTLYDQR